jgi:cytochrome c5
MNASRIVAALLVFAPVSVFAAGPVTATGRAVYESVCIACHAPENVMVAAPKFGDADQWRVRLSRSANGIETLTKHAIDGFGAMPPKGGAANLSSAEIKNAIAYMMAGEQPGGAGHSPGRSH